VSLDATPGSDDELFHALYYAHAAVGLNTSAMLEAAIVGTPVHTLMIPGFDEGQIGTIHFHYLVEAYGGLATVARDLDEHQTQLSSLLLHGEPQRSARSRVFAQHFLRPRGVDRPVSPILVEEIVRAAAITKRARATEPAWYGPLRRALLHVAGTRRPRATAAGDRTAVATLQSLRPARTALQELQEGTAPVFVGPWNDSVANELLYWIPFVRWACDAYGLAPDRLMVVSNGGAREWYGLLGDRFLDARSLFSSADLQRWRQRTVPQGEQDYKQAVMSPFDVEILERAARAFDVSEYQVLHPLTLFRVLSRFRKDHILAQLADVLRHEPLDASARQPVDSLPSSFVAVSLAFTEVLPDDEENRQMLTTLLEQAAATRDVVIVDCPAPPHTPARLPARVHRLDAVPGADANPLLLQTRALAQASAFAGGLGDLAVLASFCGTPAVTYHSERLPADVEDRLGVAAATAGWGAVRIERARWFKGIRLPADKVYA
jgi:hypothetical protein